jgi:superfamily II DNA helicase RecQ
MSISHTANAARYGNAKPQTGANSTTRSQSGSGNKSSGAPHRVPGEVELAILRLVELLKGQVGRTTIAQILAGSKAKKITERELHKNEFHGAFAGVGEKGLLSIVDTIVERGEIRVTPGLYPKVLIAPAGKQKIAAES